MDQDIELSILVHGAATNPLLAGCRAEKLSGLITAAGPTGARPAVCVTANVPIEWTEISAVCTYSEHGRKDRLSASHRQAGNRAAINWRSAFIGGRLEVTVKARAQGREHSRTAVARVGGENPSKALVKSHAADAELQVLAFVATSFTHFAAEKPHVVYLAGQPRFGCTLLQAPTTAQIWNWRQNLDEGRRRFDDEKRLAAQYPSEERKKGTAVPDFRPEELLREAYQQYFRDEHYYVPDGSGNWTRGPGDATLADTALAILQQLAGGTEPPGWS